MANRKKYLDIDCYEAAKQRIMKIYSMFDSLVVLFSGGKDSLVVMRLVKEVFDELGIKGKVNVVFRDEELINGSVIDFVAEYHDVDWVDMKWLCIADNSQVYLLGKSFSYVHWDKNREYLRKPPEYALMWNDHIYDDEEKDNSIANLFSGKVALMLGNRADESMGRYASFLGKLHDSWITGDSPKFKMVKPIYDWTENDIFKYLYDKKIAYCPVYDYQLFAGKGLRVAGPLHTESAKHLDKLKSIDPELYANCLKLFPQVAAQERYSKDLNQDKDLQKYGQTFDGIRQYLYATVEDKETLLYCLSILKKSKTLYYNYPKAYPIEHIAKQFIRGRVQSKHIRGIMPLGKDQQK